MSENLPAVRPEPAAVTARRDTDSWAEQLPAVVELARAIANTDFVPEALRNNIAATTAAVLYGREVGLPPMTALGNVNVIKGRPGLSAVIMRAQVLAAGHEIRQDESTSARCVLSGRRRGTDYWQTVTYTMEDAKLAGHLRNEQYTKNPRRMLRARATSELCELMFADVVRGMPSLEDLEDLESDAGTPPPTTTTRVQRKARTTKNGAAPAVPVAPDDGPASPPPSSPPLPPLPGEPGAETDDAAETPPLPLEDALPPPPDIEGARKALHARFNELGYTKDERELRLLICMAIADEDIQSSNDLTFDGIRKILDTLARCQTKEQVAELMRAMAGVGPGLRDTPPEDQA